MGGILLPIVGVGASNNINPSQLPSLNLWYDATTGNAAQFGSTLSDGSVVTTWKDLSGTGHDANKAGSSTVKPTWQANELNGYGVVEFTASETDSLDINPIAWAQSLPGATIYVVSKAYRLGTSNNTIVTSNQGDFNISWDGNYWQVKQAGGTGRATSLAADTNNYHIFGQIFDGTQSGNDNRLKFRYDGQPITLDFGATTVGTATNASANYLYLGRDAAGTVYFQGAIGTIMIWTRALSITECLQVEAYLKSIWNLPSNNTIVTDSLQVYLSGGSYQGSGTTWTGLKNAVNATLVNTPTYTVTSPGYFNFAPASLEEATLPAISSLSNWTIESWFRVTSSLSGKCTAVVTDIYDLAKLNFSMGTNIFPTNSNICIGFYNGAWRTTTGFAPSLNTWYHVVGTYDGNTITQYVNGSSNTTLSYAGTSQASGLGMRIARRWDEATTSTNYFPGDISVVRIYSNALSASQVLKNYNASKAMYGL